MQQKLRTVVFLVPLVFLPILFCDARRETLAGEWQLIKDIDGPDVREVAEFALSEYNKQSKTSLKLESVVTGEMQVVAGFNYKLDLKTTDDAKLYEAVVWEKAGLASNNRSLTSFKPIHG